MVKLVRFILNNITERPLPTRLVCETCQARITTYVGTKKLHHYMDVPSSEPITQIVSPNRNPAIPEICAEHIEKGATCLLAKLIAERRKQSDTDKPTLTK